MSFLKRLVRQAKVTHPYLNEVKFKAQFATRRAIRRPHEDIWNILKDFEINKSENEFHVLDIGANRGQTIESIRNFRAFRITSVEPLPNLYTALHQKYNSVEGVQVLNYFITDTTGSITIYIPKYNGVFFDGLASADPEEATRFFTPDRFLFFDRGKLSVEEVIVEGRKLDSFEFEPDFIKADVQGFELEVLKGGQETILKHRPIIVLERPENDREVAFLQGFGYQPWTYERGVLRSGFNANNVFFLCEHHSSMFRNSFKP